MRKYIIFLLGFLMCSLTAVKAQETQLKQPVLDKTQSVGPNSCKIIILSNNDNLSMTHSMGTETGVREEQSKGISSYTILYNFPEDYEDDFIKTQLTLRMDAGQETIPMVLHKGKVYTGSYYEVLKLNVKKDSDSVYPYEHAAKVSFISALEDLTILCNGHTCFMDGKKQVIKDSNVTLDTEQKEGQKEYSLVFSLKEAPAKVNLKNNLEFQILAPGFSKTLTKINEVNSRTSYNYIITGNVKIIEKEKSYEELLEIANGYVKQHLNQSQSVFFATTAEAFKAVRAHEDCPLDLKDWYQMKVNDFNTIRLISSRVEQAEKIRANALKKEGSDSKTVWKCLNFECKQLEKLTSQFPGLVYYSDLKNKIETEFNNHPLSKITYATVQGTVTKGDGWFLPVDGTNIYGVTMEANSMKDVKHSQPIGHVTNGSYKVVLREPYNYLYFAGEKHSHAITGNDQILDIELTR